MFEIAQFRKPINFEHKKVSKSHSIKAKQLS